MRLREWRKEAGLTVFKLAKISDVSVRTINRIEKGESCVVRWYTAQRLSMALTSVLKREIAIGDLEGVLVE